MVRGYFRKGTAEDGATEIELAGTRVDSVVQSPRAEMIVHVETKKKPIFPGVYSISRPDESARRRGVVERFHLALSEPAESKIGMLTLYIVVALIIISCVSFVLESVPHYHEYKDGCEQCKPVSSNDPGAVNARKQLENYCQQSDCEPESMKVFGLIELSTVIIFTIEYSLRLFSSWDAVQLREHQASWYDFEDNSQLWKGMVRTMYWMVEPMNIVDFLTVAPFWMQYRYSSFPRVTVVRVVRLLRLFRLYERGALSAGTAMFLKVFQESITGFLTLAVFTGFGVVVLATVIFFAERGHWNPATGRYVREAQYYLDENEDSPFVSIPQTFWFVIVTFTTVGYGDMSPTTSIGQVLGAVTMYTGVFLLAMPITLIANNFSRVHEKIRIAEENKKQIQEHRSKQLLYLLTIFKIIPMREYMRRWKATAKQMQKDENDVELIMRRVLREEGVQQSTRRNSKEYSRRQSSPTAASPSPDRDQIQRALTELKVELLAEMRVVVQEEFKTLKQAGTQAL